MSDFIIRDPNTGDAAKVEDDHLLTLSVTETEAEHVSADESLAFSWNIVGADFAAAETLLLLQNTSSDKALHIDKVVVSTDNASEVDIYLVDGAATPSGGTAVVGRCLNRSAAKVAEATAFSNETGNDTQGVIIWTQRIAADTPETVLTPGVIIPNNGAIGVDITTAPTSFAHCTIFGHYV